MPLNVPNLDDRTYGDLVEEALAMLPRYAPGWTDHNPSDPGITIIELLAYFAEHFIYRLNRVTTETRLRFLQLLVGVGAHGASGWAALSAEDIDRHLRQAVRDLRRPERAVTAEDYDALARDATAKNQEENRRIIRAQSFVRRNLELADDAGREADAPGHVSIVSVPAERTPPDAVAALIAQVREYLEPRRLLATRLHVVEPFYLWIRLGARLHMRVDATEEQRATSRETAVATLQKFGSPWSGGGRESGGSDGDGWPFGRALYLSEVYEQLEGIPGVDYVDDLDVIELSVRGGASDDRTPIGIKVGGSTVGVDSWLSARREHGRDRVLVDSAGKMIGIALKPYELVRIASRVEDVSIAESARGVSGVEPARRAANDTRLVPVHPADRAEHLGGGPDRSAGAAARPPGGRLARRGMARERLLAQLPGVYHASAALRQLLGAFETILCEPHERALEEQIARIAMVFDVTGQELPVWLSERRDALLPWLAQWVALSGPGALTLEGRRRLIGQIVPLYAWRGTGRSVTDLLTLYLPDGADVGVEDGQFRGLVLGQARAGVDAWLAEDRPFWFKVTIRMPDAAGGRTDWRERIRQVIDLAKPAHTTYDLELVASQTDML
ncbi:MAG TPA: phage tail protein [Candidatus Acidoferrum sp.]|nr:phage tail protein [Candidatus Acidoferrum sp.]